jgi:DNA-binding protein H-NS
MPNSRKTEHHPLASLILFKLLLGINILPKENIMARTSSPPPLKDLSWLEQLTFEQLAKLAEAIQSLLDAKRHELREQLRKELIEKARLLGIEPTELLPSHKARVNRSEVNPKYRDTRDPTQTWSGRGRVPKWLHERIAAGENKDDYLIR